MRRTSGLLLAGAGVAVAAVLAWSATTPRAVAQDKVTFRMNWAWGGIHTATWVSNPLGASGIDLIEGIVNRGPFATSGGAGIVNATNWSASAGNFAVRSLPSMRFIADLGDLSQSLTSNTTVEGGIRFGLGAIKNVGRGAVESILAARARQGRFANLFELAERVDLRQSNKRVLESLVAAGACDGLEGHRAQQIALLDLAIAHVEEADAAMIAPRVHPAAHDDLAADVGRAQRARHVGALPVAQRLHRLTHPCPPVCPSSRISRASAAPSSPSGTACG